MCPKLSKFQIIILISMLIFQFSYRVNYRHIYCLSFTHVTFIIKPSPSHIRNHNEDANNNYLMEERICYYSNWTTHIMKMKNWIHLTWIFFSLVQNKPHESIRSFGSCNKKWTMMWMKLITLYETWPCGCHYKWNIPHG